MEMTLEEYKKQLEEVVKKEKKFPQYLRETLEKTPDSDWRECLEMNLDPSTALYSVAQGLI